LEIILDLDSVVRNITQRFYILFLLSLVVKSSKMQYNIINKILTLMQSR
jgi:hypothetical protein